MTRKRLLAIPALVAAASLATAAAAQTNDERLIALVGAWTAANDFSPVVKSFGNDCMVPVMVARPEAAKQILVNAGELDAGLLALEVADPAAHQALLVELEPCVSTMLLGDKAWNWVQVAAAGETTQRMSEITMCLMEAVHGLSSEAKQRIYLGTDFATGARTLTEERPDLAGDLDPRLAACF